MRRTFRFGCYTLAAGFALATRAAVGAEFASFGYPPQAVQAFGAATASSVVSIPNDSIGIHGFFLNFVLPRDFVTNGKVRIVVYLATSAARSCNMLFEPVQLSRWRPGVNPLLNSPGLSPADGSRFVAFPNNTVRTKVFTLSRDAAFPGGQRPGDAFRVALGREGGDPADTCGTVQVPAIDVLYPRAP